MAKKNASVSAAAKTADVVVKVDENLVESLQGKGLALFTPMLAEAVKLEIEGGSYNASDTAPGYGQVSFEIGFPESLVEKMKEKFAAEAKALGLGISNVRVLGRLTFEFASLVSGKTASRAEIDWNELAGHVPENDDDYNFSMLRKEWLGQSFLYAMNEYGDYWYTIVGLNPTSARPVLVVCNDKDDNDGTVYRLEAELVAEHVKQMATRKISDELKARMPDGAVIAKWTELPKSEKAA